MECVTQTVEDMGGGANASHSREHSDSRTLRGFYALGGPPSTPAASLWALLDCDIQLWVGSRAQIT